jgi:hypothetical protein
LPTLCTLHCDGRSLQPPRLGPGPRAVLQKLIDALIATPGFNVEVARGQTIVEQAQVTLSELNRFFIVIVDAARFTFPDVNNIVAAFFPLVCSNCGGTDWPRHQQLLFRSWWLPACRQRHVSSLSRGPHATHGFMTALVTAALAAPAVRNRPTGNSPPATCNRHGDMGTSGLSALPPQCSHPATKESSASSVCVVPHPRGGSQA